MNNYTLHLKANNNKLSLPLLLKESRDFLDDYFDSGSGEFVYNDNAYSVSVTDDCDNIISIDKIIPYSEAILTLSSSPSINNFRDSLVFFS